MKNFRLIVFLLVMLLITGSMKSIPADAKTSHPKELQVEKLFNGIEGTTVIKNLQNNNTYIYNQKRSSVRYTPESTFKITNALIGLQTKAVNDEYEVKRWDGVIREIEAWNADHSLASGMRNSVIWFYQAMARDIGVNDMEYYLDPLKYGNGDISGGIDQFWLDSSLKISAQEQVHFIEALVEERLPFNKQHMRTVKRIMINEENDSFVIHEKTGTRLSDLGLGWYVGYVETKKGDWVFATNIDGSGSQAKAITLNILREQKIILE